VSMTMEYHYGDPSKTQNLPAWIASIWESIDNIGIISIQKTVKVEELFIKDSTLFKIEEILPNWLQKKKHDSLALYKKQKLPVLKYMFQVHFTCFEIVLKKFLEDPHGMKFTVLTKATTSKLVSDLCTIYKRTGKTHDDMMKNGLITILKEIIHAEPMVVWERLIPNNLMSGVSKLGKIANKTFFSTLTKAFYFGAICYANEIAIFMNDIDRYLQPETKLPNPCYWVLASNKLYESYFFNESDSYAPNYWWDSYQLLGNSSQSIIKRSGHDAKFLNISTHNHIQTAIAITSIITRAQSSLSQVNSVLPENLRYLVTLSRPTLPTHELVSNFNNEKNKGS